MTASSKKALSELDEFVEALEDEIFLDKEKANILKNEKSSSKEKKSSIETA